MIVILINAKDVNYTFGMLDGMGVDVTRVPGGVEVSQASLNSVLTLLEQSYIVHSVNE